MGEQARINEVTSALESARTQLNYERELRDKSNAAELTRYDNLQEEQKQLATPSEEEIKKEIKAFNDIVPNIKEQDIDKIIKKVIPKQNKRIKFDQDLIDTEVFSSFHGQKHQDVIQSNDEEQSNA